MEKIANLVVSAIANVVANYIQSIGKEYGIDPNKPASETIKELSNYTTKIKDALNSPEGQILKKEIGELIADNFDVIKPSIEEAEEILLEGINKVSNTINGIIATAVNELPPIFDVWRLRCERPVRWKFCLLVCGLYAWPHESLDLSGRSIVAGQHLDLWPDDGTVIGRTIPG